MSPATLGASAGLLVAAGGVLAVRIVRPAEGDLFALLHPVPASGQREDTSSWQSRLGAAVAKAAGGRLKLPDNDLKVLDLSASAFVGRCAVLGLVGLLLPAFLGGLVSASGTKLPFALPAAMSLVFAVGFAVAPIQSIKQAAEQRRREFRAALTAYLQLVALERAAGAGADDAIRRAATVADSWTFTRIQEAIEEAALAGRTPWHGLASLGSELDVPELIDLSTIIGVAAHDGASVYDTLVAKAASMRSASLAEAKTRANAASTRMHVPATAIFYSLLILLLYPLVITIH